MRPIFGCCGRSFRAALLASIATAAMSGVAQAQNWVATATHAIDATSLVDGVDLGPLGGNERLTVRIGMLVQNQASLVQLVERNAGSATPSFLTAAQFAQTYGATQTQIAQVVAYLGAQGFRNISVEPNGLLISAEGNARQAEAAFNTTLEKVTVNGLTGFVNTAPAQVPASLTGVAAVLGLNTIGRMSSPLVGVPQYGVSYTPAQFQTIYSAAGTAPAAKSTIAIMAEGELSGVVTDLRTAEAAFGLPQVEVKIVRVGTNSSDTSGADEWDLDTQYSTGIAQTVRKLYLYDTTSLSDSDLALEFSRFASDDLAQAGSASLGECEAFPYLDGSMVVDDEIFLEAAAQGQSFFASSGDTGSFCPIGIGTNGIPAGAPFVSYPAASPYVVGVGGTTLLTNSDGSYNSEVSWYSGGGGLSQFEAPPAWQAAATPLVTLNNTRGVPDIAMDADPESGALVYVNGTPEGVGGTSLSSPLALGIWARVLTANKKAGVAGPAFYSLYDGTTTPPTYPNGGFNDITVGTNGLYTALPGYDLTTGLGTFIINQLVPDLKN